MCGGEQRLSRRRIVLQVERRDEPRERVRLLRLLAAPCRELLDALLGVQRALGDGAPPLFGDVSEEKVNQLFRAFDLDEGSGTVDYEAFVNMVAGRGAWV